MPPVSEVNMAGSGNTTDYVRCLPEQWMDDAQVSEVNMAGSGNTTDYVRCLPEQWMDDAPSQ